MEEQLITFGTAKLAKEKGFDVELHLYYSVSVNSGDIISSDNIHKANLNLYDDVWSRPTQSLLQKWLREEYIIDINITRVGSDFPYYLQITQYGNKCDILGFDEYFIIYEEALEKGLQEALKLIK